MLRFLGARAVFAGRHLSHIPIQESLTRSSVKRTLDVIGALLLLVITLPALIAIAGLVKLSSRGPILFSHPRVGRDGVSFMCLKFRTMHEDRALTSGDARRFATSYKLRDDPRVTIVGRVLRRSSLDELPQLWNVIRGSMSLVGPRPLVDHELRSQYSIEARKRLLSVRPGLTGPWQVSGPPRADYPGRAQIEAEYASSCSLRADALIILKTVWSVMSLRGSG